MTSPSMARGRVSELADRVIHPPAADVAHAAVLELMRDSNLSGPAVLDRLWRRYSPGLDLRVLVSLVKADLKARFDRGERPTAAEYVGFFEVLRADRDRVVSLVYDEFCQLEDRGERPDPEAFCDQYEPWRDSLLSQLRCHDLMSQAAGYVTPRRALPQTGDRFLTFRLGQVLGRGGSASVFLAHDESLGDRLVALKVSTDQGKEPSIQGRLDHDHIVPILSVRDDPETGLRGMCMPYRPGLSLDEVIRLVEPGSRPKTAKLLRDLAESITPTTSEDPTNPVGWRGFPTRGSYAQGVAWLIGMIAHALAYAHARGVFHRDVKPANILLTRRDGPQLLDFNLSHDPHAVDRATAALRGGTLPYMAPEQLAAFLNPEGWNFVGPAADVFSLGLVLREMLTGQRPESPPPSTPAPRAIRELLDRRALGFAPARLVNPDIPHGLQAILDRCLEYKPEERYSSAAALAEDLRRFLRYQPPVEARNPSAVERARNWTRRFHAARIVVVATSLIALTFAVPMLGFHRRDPKDAGKYVVAALAYLDSGRWEKALEQSDIALSLNPRLYTAHQARAKANGKLKNFEAALIDSRKALECGQEQVPPIKPDALTSLYLNVGTISQQTCRPDEARAAYLKAAEVSPGCHTAFIGLGMIADEKKQYPEALEHLARAIRILELAAPQTSETRLALARYHRLHAFITVHFGQAVQREKAVSDRERAESLFWSALDEVERIESMHVASDNGETFWLLFIKASAKHELGDIAGQRKDKSLALQNYQEARRDADHARPLGGPAKAVFVDGLKRSIDANLHKLAGH